MEWRAGAAAEAGSMVAFRTVLGRCLKGRNLQAENEVRWRDWEKMEEWNQ